VALLTADQGWANLDYTSLIRTNLCTPALAPPILILLAARHARRAESQSRGRESLGDAVHLLHQLWSNTAMDGWRSMWGRDWITGSKIRSHIKAVHSLSWLAKLSQTPITS